MEGSPGGVKKRMLNMDSIPAPLIWNDAKIRSQDINVAQGNPHGITKYGKDEVKSKLIYLFRFQVEGNPMRGENAT